MSSNIGDQYFKATLEASALKPIPVGGEQERSQQATESLVAIIAKTGRPEDAAHKRRRRRRQCQSSLRPTLQLIYSIRTYHDISMLLLLGTFVLAHTTGTILGGTDAGQHARESSGAQQNPKDHFHYYFPPPVGSNSTISQTISIQQPSHRSQLGHYPAHTMNNSPRAPKQTRTETLLRPNAEARANQQNAWIPIVATSSRAAAVAVAPIEQPVRQSQPRRRPAGSSAPMLDYRSPRPRPRPRQQLNPRPNRGGPKPYASHRGIPHHALGTGTYQKNKTRVAAPTGARQVRGGEIQLAQASHVYHQRNNYPPPPPVHTSTHHYHHHHHHHWPAPMAHRTPRYQHTGAELGPADNELSADGPGLPEASKMYKRVLLCDKTLVSLDYVRSLDLAEPRPYGARAHKFPPAHLASYYHHNHNHNHNHNDHLTDYEINEITYNSLDLEGNFDSSLSRSSSSSSWAPSSNLTTGAQSQNATTTTTTTTSTSYEPNLIQRPPPVGQLSLAADRLAANESLPTTEITLNLTEHELGEETDPTGEGASERRGHALSYREPLLNDQDPLVRCDMWDLEKGLKSRKPPANILRMAIRADFDTVRDAINRCRQLSERTLPPEDEYRGDSLELMSTEDLVSLFSMKRGLMPGTKWCGLGDQAETYNDLGPKHRIDICCRAHDHCPIRSKPFRNDYGILNIGLYTKSHCDCDADFYRCLREVRTRTADMLGNLYFNVMKLQCMREERLKVCREMKPLALGFERCIRYEDSPVKTVFKFTTPPVAY